MEWRGVAEPLVTGDSMTEECKTEIFEMPAGLLQSIADYLTSRPRPYAELMEIHSIVVKLQQVNLVAQPAVEAQTSGSDDPASESKAQE